jgi:hypothetical protein
VAAKVEILEATAADAHELAPRMRAADAAEVLASGGYAPLDALLEGLLFSSEAYAARFNGELVALFGIVPGPADEAYPWLLTSAAVERHRGAFLRASRAVIEDWTARFPVLVQQVDARYAAALRWAARIGFEVAEPAPFGQAGLPFCRITLRRDVHV